MKCIHDDWFTRVHRPSHQMLCLSGGIIRHDAWEIFLVKKPLGIRSVFPTPSKAQYEDEM